jgi:4-amino-4-deoxy-L-arabinose transferase-like glycosyltransferase
MTDQAVSTRARSVVVALLLALFCGTILLERLHTYDEPLERDVATYAVIAREMRHGRALYSDLWDNKPPLLYVIVGAAQLLAGDGAGSVFLIGLCGAVATALALYAAGARAGGTAAGLSAAAAWALLSGDLALQANQPNIEALLNVALAAGFAALLGAGVRVFDRRVLAAALCLTVAILLKPVVAPVVIALAVAHLAWPPAEASRARASLQSAVILGLCGAACAAVAGYFYVTGRWADFWRTLVVHNQYYAGPLLPNLREGFRPARLFPAALRDAWPLVAAALPGLAVGIGRRWPRPAALLAAWLVAVPLVVAAPGKFFPHYYQLWLPPLCLAAGWSIAAVAARTSSPRGVAAAAAATLCAVLGTEVGPSYARPAADWSEAKYGDVFLRARDVAGDARAMLAPGETFFQWGNEPELYLYVPRAPPTGVLWAQYLQYGPMRLELRSRALEQLSLADPQLVVFSRDQPPPTGALGQWFKERYELHPLLHRRAGFSFWVRRGGSLQRRLLNGDGA